MQTATEILEEIFEPSPQDCKTHKEDLQLAITLNPDIEKIIDCMFEFSGQFKSWVPVTERLPQDGKGLIVYDKVYKQQCIGEYNNGVWTLTAPGEIEITTDVTH